MSLSQNGMEIIKNNQNKFKKNYWALCKIKKSRNKKLANKSFLRNMENLILI